MVCKSGIYKIANLINDKLYIGSAVNLSKRKSNHFQDLKNNKHHNIHLQNSWNKYGENNFKFKIIEIVDDKEKLLEREQYYINLYKSYESNIGYNINPTAGSNLGVKRSKETRDKISKINKGRKITDKQKEKMRKAKLGENHPRTKLNDKKVIEIKKLINKGVMLRDIAEMFNVKPATISGIKSGRTWSHIKKESIIKKEIAFFADDGSIIFKKSKRSTKHKISKNTKNTKAKQENRVIFYYLSPKYRKAT